MPRHRPEISLGLGGSNRKHHCRKNGSGHRRYAERLRKRGVSSASVRMESLEELRNRQGMYCLKHAKLDKCYRDG